jgi:hypothetical protein
MVRIEGLGDGQINKEKRKQKGEIQKQKLKS